MPRIVISYRRADRADRSTTNRIFDRLVAKYGDNSVFMDTMAIPPGTDFRSQIASALRDADAMLVMVGEKWLGLKGGQYKIKEPTDWVRIEVETALATKVPIFPVLIGKGKMPTVDQLPDSLKDFPFIQAAPIDEEKDFHRDVGELIGWIDQAIDGRKKALEQKAASEQQTALDEQKAAAVLRAAEQQKALDAQKAFDERKTLEQRIARDAERAAEAQRALEAQKALEAKKALDAQQALQARRALEEKQAIEDQAKTASEAKAAHERQDVSAERVLDRTANPAGMHPRRRVLVLAGLASAALLLFGFVFGPSLWNLGKAPPAATVSPSDLRADVRRPETVIRPPDAPMTSAAALPAAKPAVSPPPRTASPVRAPGRPLVTASAASSCEVRTASASTDGQGGLFQPIVLTPNKPADIHAVAISADAATIATAGDDGLVRLWDANSFKLLHALPGHDKEVYGLEFGLGGKLLASAGWDGKVRIWDVETGKAIRVLGDPGAPSVHFYSVAFTSDQPATVLHYVVAAGDDGLVRIWDMTQDGPPTLRDDHNIRNGGRSPKEKDAKDVREFNTTRSLSFAPDGSGEFVTAGFDGTLRFHLTTGRRIEAVNAHGGKILRVVYSPDGRRVVSAGGDESGKKYLKVWNVKDRSPFKSFDGHASYVVAAAWSSDSRYLATGGGDRSIRVWDASTGEQIQMYAKAHAGDIESIAFVPGTNRFLSVSEDGMMKVWDTRGGELLAAAGYDDKDYLAYTPVGCYAGSDGIERRFKLTSAGHDVTINGGVRRAQFVPEGFALRR